MLLSTACQQAHSLPRISHWYLGRRLYSHGCPLQSACLDTVWSVRLPNQQDPPLPGVLSNGNCCGRLRNRARNPGLRRETGASLAVLVSCRRGCFSRLKRVFHHDCHLCEGRVSSLAGHRRPGVYDHLCGNEPGDVGALREIREEVGEHLSSLRDNAYGIYLVHYAFVTWLQYALLKSQLSGVVKLAIVLSLAVALSWITTAALRRIPAVARVM